MNIYIYILYCGTVSVEISAIEMAWRDVRGKRVKVLSISIGFQIGELRVSTECIDTESGR